MGSLLEVLDKISKEVSEEKIKQMINLDDFYKLCVEYGYSSTQDIFTTEYKDILEKSIDSLTKSELSDDELDSVSGGSSSRFKSGVALVLASIGTLSPSIGATSHKSSSALSNQTSLSEKISGYTKSGKEHISSGLNYLRNGAEYLLDKGKESLTKGLEYASKYGSKFVEYSSDAVKQAGDFVKAHPVGSSVTGGAVGLGVVGTTGAILIKKSSSNSKNPELASSSSSKNIKINDENQKNTTQIKTHFSNVVNFIKLVSPMYVNEKNTCDFVGLSSLEQEILINSCLQDLGANKKLTLKSMPPMEIIASCIKTLYARVSSILKDNSENQNILKELASIQHSLVELSKIYNVQLETNFEQNKQPNISVPDKTDPKRNAIPQTTIVKMNLNGIETEIQLEGEHKAGDYVKVCVNGKMVHRELDENMNIILDNNDIQIAKELKEQKDLEDKVTADLIAKEQKDAENYIKKNKEKVTNSEKRLVEIYNEVNSLDKEISNTNALLEDCRKKLSGFEIELKQAEDDYNKSKTTSANGSDFEKMQQRAKMSSLNGLVTDCKERISKIKTQIEKNEKKKADSEIKRKNLTEEKNKMDTDNIKKYHQYEETLKSIEKGTYKVDETKLKEEILKKKPVKQISNPNDMKDDLFNQMQLMEQTHGNDSDDIEEESEEEWTDD